MFTKNETFQLKNALPSKGIKEIGKRSNLSVTTIYKFFNGAKVKEKTAEKIWITGWKVVKKQEQKNKELRSLMTN